MYNGIGLATVRGSGTNGYVTKNLSFVSQTRAAERKERSEGFKARDIPQPKKPDADIIEHNRKRDVEVKVFKLREALEDQGVDEAEIEKRTSELRTRLLAQLPAPAPKARKGANEPADPRGAQETHSMAARKEEETRALKSALGIASEYQHGQAFDRELQEKRKQERLAQRAAEEAKVAELEALLEKEKRREERQAEKDRKRAEKEEKKRKKREAKGKPPKEGSSSAPPPPEEEEEEPRRDEDDEPRREKRTRDDDDDDDDDDEPAPRRSRRDER